VSNSLKMFKEVQSFHHKTLTLYMFSNVTRALVSKTVIWSKTCLRAGLIGKVDRDLAFGLPLVLVYARKAQVIYPRSHNEIVAESEL